MKSSEDHVSLENEIPISISTVHINIVNTQAVRKPRYPEMASVIGIAKEPTINPPLYATPTPDALYLLLKTSERNAGSGAKIIASTNACAPAPINAPTQPPYSTAREVGYIMAANAIV